MANEARLSIPAHCVEYEIGVDPAEAAELGTLVLDPLEYLPTIPSLGVLWKL